MEADLMQPTSLAILYASLAALPMTMHIALAAGAPLGRFTVGGRFPDRLPPLWRVLALVQAVILLAMAGSVLARAGVLDVALPPWSFWLALVMTGLTCCANLATPSRPERLLWGPVTTAMLVAGLGVAAL